MNLRKILALVLVFAMCLSFVPTYAFAEDDGIYAVEEEEPIVEVIDEPEEEPAVEPVEEVTPDVPAEEETPAEEPAPVEDEPAEEPEEELTLTLGDEEKSRIRSISASALTLSACTGAKPEASPSPVPKPTATPTPTAKPTATPTPHVHTAVTDPAVEATCKSTGLTEGAHCSTCGQILTPQQVTPVVDHYYLFGQCIWCGEREKDWRPHEVEIPDQPVWEESGVTVWSDGSVELPPIPIP